MTNHFTKKWVYQYLLFHQKCASSGELCGGMKQHYIQVKNVHESFEVSSGEDCKYIFSSKNIKDSIGMTGYGTQCEKVLEVVATGHSSDVIGLF